MHLQFSGIALIPQSIPTHTLPCPLLSPLRTSSASSISHYLSHLDTKTADAKELFGQVRLGLGMVAREDVVDGV